MQKRSISVLCWCCLLSANVLWAQNKTPQAPASTLNEEAIYDPYTPEPLPHSAPVWMRSIADNPSGVNFLQMDSLYRAWIANDINARVKSLDQKPAVNFYRRWMRAYRSYVTPTGAIQLPTMRQHLQALSVQNSTTTSQRRLRRANGAELPRWRNIGPNTTKGRDNKSKDSQVCVFRLAVATNNPNIVYCGTETGVVFKSTDKGQTWQPCNAQHNFGGSIFALCVSPHDENLIYAGGGQNLWKSTDGGQTWTAEPTIANRVNSIRISPNNPKHITLCTGVQNEDKGGFYVSTDGGQSYRQTFVGVGHDHELKPDNDQHIYFLGRSKGKQEFEMWISENGGESFRTVALPVTDISAGRLAVSQAPTGKDYVYALVNANRYTYERGPQGGVGTPYILKSVDAGTTWTDETTRDGRKNTFSPFVDESHGGQGYFDMMIGVSSENPEHVIYGLCSAYRSEKGGKGWFRETAIGGYQKSDAMHPDMQDIVTIGQDTWISTDGGIKYSNDFFATPGQDRNFGLYASDYVGFGQGWNEDVMAGGRWHNGDAVITSDFGEGNSLHIGGVEQSTGHVFLSNPRKVYFSDAGVSIIPRQIGGEVQTTHFEQFHERKPFETLETNKELGFDPRFAKRLVMTSHEDPTFLYLSEDEGRSFRQIFDAEGEVISDYEFSRSNPNLLYVAGVFDIYYSTNNGESWEMFENRPFDDVGNSSGNVNIAVDPHDENKLWYSNSLYPGYVAYTTDKGQTWHYPLDEALKAYKFNRIILTGNEKNGVYLSTAHQGRVFYKDDSMNQWINYSEGLPVAARIARLAPFYKEGKLRAATSQGLWEIPLYDTAFKPVAQPMALNLGNDDLTSNPNQEVQFDSYSIVNQKDAKWEWSFYPQPQRVIGADTRSPRVVFGNKGAYDVTLKITTPQGTHSRTICKMVRIAVPTSADRTKTPTVDFVLGQGGQQFTVHSPEIAEEKILTLHDTKGVLLRKVVIPATEAQTQVALQDLPTGTYIYELRSKKYRYFGKFVK